MTTCSDVVEKAKKLSDAIEAVHAHPQWMAVWGLAAVHGDLYSGGPQYGVELDELQAVLRSLDE